MSAIEGLRDDVHKDPEQLAREADDARSAVEETLNELEQRLSPSEMLDRALDAVKRNGSEFSDNLLTQVRNNPLPTVLAGIGVAWLMTSSKRRPPARSRPGRVYGGYAGAGGEPGESGDHDLGDHELDGSEGTGGGDGHAAEALGRAGDEIGERWSSTLESVQGAMSSTKDAARDAADATTSAARSAVDATTNAAQRMAASTRHKADALTRASRTGAHSVSDGYSYLAHEQPLVLGALALVAGAALGALLPSTQSENSWLGDASDEAKARLKTEARSKVDDLQNAAGEAVEAVQETMAANGAGIDSELGAGSGEPRPDEPSPARPV